MNWKSVSAEFVGTFGFVTLGAGAVAADAYSRGGLGILGVAIAHGLALAIMISVFGAISGGHFNPAVSIALAVVGRIGWLQAAAHVIAQVAGGIVAGLLLRLMYSQIFPEAIVVAHLGAPALAREVSFGAGFLIEAVLTFFLVTTVFGTAVDRRAPKSIAGFGIGLMVCADILMGGFLTGAAMNPARAIGPAFAAEFWDNQVVYWAGPILGGIVAALVYEYVFAEREPIAPAE